MLAEVYPKESIRLSSYSDGVLSSTLRIKNLSGAKIAFKVKSNTREKYEVSPNQGVILVGSQATVEIILRSEKGILSLDKDKFMISLVKMQNFPEANDNDSIWNYVRSIAWNCEKQEIFRTVSINEDCRTNPDVERLKRDLHSNREFIAQLIKDRRENIDQILKMNHYLTTRKRHEQMKTSFILGLLVVVLLLAILVFRYFT